MDNEVSAGWVSVHPTPILIADANLALASLLREVLEDSGRYEVTLAATGQEALDVASKADYRGALIDGGLTRPPAPDVIRSLRANHVGLIVFAFSADAETDVALTEAGVEALIPKPFYLPDLVARIDLALSPRPVPQPAVTKATPPTAEYRLRLTAVLIPRLAQHVLSGAVAEFLRDWVARLCLAWGWQAQAIDVQPSYLALTLGLSPAEIPTRAVHRLRRSLSDHLLQEFPALQAELPSGRFWASGYLLTTGSAPRVEYIWDFLRQTRHSQGVEQ